MVQEILTISRLETAGDDFKKEPLDCVQIIKTYLNETEDLVTGKELQIRSRKTGGSGLGLYIVQEILHQHKSECSVCNTQSGVKFSFTI